MDTRIFLSRFPSLILIVVLFFGTGAAAAQDVETISHGERVDISASIVPGKLTLIDFYADWCGPCRSLEPTLDRLAEANPDTFAIRKVDIINWESEVTAQYRIQSIPHLKLFDENGVLLAEGNAGHVMGILNSRLGNSGSVSGSGGFYVPIFMLGGLAAIALLLVLRGKSAPRAPQSQTSHTPRAGEAPASGWFVMLQNSLEGPFAEEDLEEMVRRREITGTARARRRGESTWTTVDEIIDHLI